MAILTFLLSPIGRLIAGAAGVLVIVSVFTSHQRSIGAAKAVAKIERATNEAVSKAQSAGSKSRAGGGVLDLPYRD